ncbi:MAG: phosphatase [Hespellia sp.]|nr:phosphatase [Hespellia sp.]
MSGKYILDLHTHTIASGHAYNTINEMIRAAKEKGLALLGIAEHGPGMLGGADKFYFQNLHILEREKYGIQVRYGAELNIIELDGTVDLEERSLQDLDYCIASLHYNCMTPGTEKENTFALLTAMEHPKVSIIGHPDDGHFPVNYEELIREAKRQQVYIELNNSSFNPKGFRNNAWENNIQILKMCMKFEEPIILGSDAHREEDVGQFSDAQKILDFVEFPESLILNGSAESMKIRNLFG